MKDERITFKVVDDKVLIERIVIHNINLSKDSVCLYCPFYTGIQCHGHGDFWGICKIYGFINKQADYFDKIVYDETRCKLYKYILSQNDLKNK